MKRILPTLTLTLLAVSQPLGFSSRSSAQDEIPAVVRHMDQLNRCVKTASFRAEADEEFAQLCRLAPTDARVPYAYALVLLAQHRQREAVEALDTAIQLDGRNLDWWKSLVWLAVLQGDYEQAFQRMTSLTKRMPSVASTTAVEINCRQWAGFLGQMFGYLTGPAHKRLDPVKLATYEQLLTEQLSNGRRAIFLAQRQEVLNGYQGRLQQIQDLREQARAGETMLRQQELSRLTQDGEYTWGELKRLQDLRSLGQELASNERNTIATTRENSGGGYSSHDDTHADGQTLIGPGHVRNPADNPRNPESWNYDHLVDQRRALDRNSGAGGAYYTQRGLGDEHYANVNDREQANNEYLEQRERHLNVRHARIASEQQRLLTKPVIGTTAQLLAELEKSKALATYVPLPVSPRQELQRIVTAFRSEASTAQGAFAMNTR